VLDTANVSRVLMEIIKNIYAKFQNNVIEGSKSETFQMLGEVIWGSVISPVLFNIAMDEMIRQEG
jgi:hypothetical protein